MDRQPESGAGVRNAGLRLAVNVNLPRQRSQRGEIILVRPRLDPGQAITAADRAGRALAQRAVAIVDTDLRHGSEQEAAHRVPVETGTRASRGTSRVRTRQAMGP